MLSVTLPVLDNEEEGINDIGILHRYLLSIYVPSTMVSMFPRLSRIFTIILNDRHYFPYVINEETEV